jgi:ribosomal protein S18 acetylase RimI-like enzyme
MAAAQPGLERLDPTNDVQVEAIARLHSELLPRSVGARLGHGFMTRFYFRRLPADGLIVCDLYREEDRYVGFSTYTREPDTFMARALRRHLLELLAVSLRTFLAKPRRIAVMADLLRRSRALPADGHRTGYLLTIGVLDSYRGPRPADGETRISVALIRAMLDFFRREGFDRVDGAVERENLRAIRFYRSCGFRIEDPGNGDLHFHYDLRSPE